MHGHFSSDSIFIFIKDIGKMCQKFGYNKQAIFNDKAIRMTEDEMMMQNVMNNKQRMDGMTR